jgi:hypothetical protein
MQRGFTELHMPPLGETRRLIQETRGDYKVFPGVNFYVPEVPEMLRKKDTKDRLPGLEVTATLYEENRIAIENVGKAYGSIRAKIFWANTQRQHGVWDYKDRANGDHALALRLSNIGYFNGEYTGAQKFTRAEIGIGYGFVKMAQALRGSGPYYGPLNNLTAGNKPSGFIYGNMGYDYYDSGQYIRDFIDNLSISRAQPLEQRLLELKMALRSSAEEEFARRWEILRNEAKEKDSALYEIMVQQERERAEAEAEKIRREARRQIEARKREKELEEERARYEWQRMHEPIPNYPPAWTPPAPPLYKPPSPPLVTPYSPPPAPRPVPWLPFPPYRHGGGGNPCEGDCDSNGPEIPGPG